MTVRSGTAIHAAMSEPTDNWAALCSAELARATSTVQFVFLQPDVEVDAIRPEIAVVGLGREDQSPE